MSPLISSSGPAVPSPLLTAEQHEVSAEAPYSCLAKPPGPSCTICLLEARQQPGKTLKAIPSRGSHRPPPSLGMWKCPPSPDTLTSQSGLFQQHREEPFSKRSRSKCSLFPPRLLYLALKARLVGKQIQLLSCIKETNAGDNPGQSPDRPRPRADLRKAV